MPPNTTSDRLEGEALAFVARPGRFATLATTDPDGSPRTAVLWYALRGDAILVNSAEGRRWPANLRRDPRCSFSVEDGYDYVAVRAIAEEVGDAEQGLTDISALARAYLEPDEAEHDIRENFSRQRRVSFLLHPRRVTVHH